MFMVGNLLRFGSIAAWIFRIIACMGGCIGCCTKPKLISARNEPLQGPKHHTLTASKPNISEDFWTTSACEMDNSAVQSFGSISPISSSTQIYDASSSNNPSEYINHGLLLWNQTRQKWIGNKKSEKLPQKHHEPRLSWNATYDSLLSSNKPFPKPIPLAEMVDFLVDIWEQEGLYD
ncbi:Hypothetical predicted protein [Olea europaea subsp. europaea]|uniref:Gag1-like clamp domain-containing protein n=1 Tax=Olea europaea subsp. europaea TaxID=158383 RepID=A0A8S0SXI8_OLEEU|nr:Hypothetical predicted protein [Olea europaea subsp. europaea]